MKRIITHLDDKLGKLYVPFVLFGLTIFMFLIGYPFVRPVDTTATLNAIATHTIRANRTVEDVDATKRAKENAASAVLDVYDSSETIAEERNRQVAQFFAVMSNYRKELEQSVSNGTTQEQRISELTSRFFGSLNNDNKAIQTYARVFSDNVLRQLLSATDKEYDTYETITKTVVADILKESIYPTTSDIEKYRGQASNQIVSLIYSDNAREFIRDLVNPAITATMIVNEEATKQAKEKARLEVTPIIIAQGDIIVREGEAIGTTAYRKLELLGMTANQYNTHLLFGYLLMLGLQFAFVWYIIIRQAPTVTKRNMYVNMYSFLMVVASLLLVGAHAIQTRGVEYFSLIAPIGIIPFFVTPKAERRIGVMMIGFLLAFYFFVSGFSDVLQTPLVWRYYALFGLFSTVVVSGKKEKARWRHFAILLALSMLIVTMLALANSVELVSSTFGVMLVYGVLNVVLTAMLLRVSQPYFDLLFEDKAVLRLVDLSNPNQPLLKELIAQAPGTYHHSIMVANLSANAVELIGGDSLFTRVACYYHDIGKLKNPMFFIENLPAGMENPHKILTPQESRDIIFEHVSAGVKRLAQEGLPKAIIDICAEHHGQTILKYFYVLAKEEDESVEEADFRYPGPKPKTKESAVVSIADTVEAAARAMKNPTKDAIEKLVKDTIQSRITDGQFDECPITMEELKIVERSLIAGVSSSYHTRVEYPKLSKK